MIWRDVPFLVVIGWGTMTMLALSVADRLYTWWGMTNRIAKAVVDVVVFAALGYANEVLMSSQGYWVYNSPLHGMPAIQILGYVGVGILVSNTGRAIQSYISHR
jgi:uncharacterized membrane protein